MIAAILALFLAAPPCACKICDCKTKPQGSFGTCGYCACRDGGPCFCAEKGRRAVSYDAAYAQAISEGRPLVCFIGSPPLEIPGAVVFAAPSVPWHKGPAIIVSMPRGSWIEWCETLSPMAPASQVREAIAKHSRPAAAAPRVYVHPFTAPDFSPLRFSGRGRSC